MPRKRRYDQHGVCGRCDCSSTELLQPLARARINMLRFVRKSIWVTSVMGRRRPPHRDQRQRDVPRNNRVFSSYHGNGAQPSRSARAEGKRLKNEPPAKDDQEDREQNPGIDQSDDDHGGGPVSNWSRPHRLAEMPRRIREQIGSEESVIQMPSDTETGRFP